MDLPCASRFFFFFSFNVSGAPTDFIQFFRHSLNYMLWDSSYLSSGLNKAILDL
jgi:hypothetical protein